MITLESKFVHNGINMTVIERTKPTVLAEFLRNSNIVPAGAAVQLARDVYQLGVGSISAKAWVLTPRDYLLDIDIDLSGNARLRRDLTLLAIYNRLSAFFGARAAAAQAVSEANPAGPLRGPLAMPGSTPPTSVLGDIWRYIGHLIGLSCDYLMSGIWWVCTDVRRRLA